MIVGLAANEGDVILVNRLPEGPADPASEPKGFAALQKQAVVSRSVLTALFLGSFKLVVGLGTGSLGILSEAVNSGLDVLAAVLIYFTVWISEKPADANHPYGHQKIENFAAFLQTGLVFATCIWIVAAAVRRLLFAPADVEVNVWAVGIMLVSIAVSWFRARELEHAAREHRSQALESHALNYRLDIWSATVVLFGLAMLLAGKRWGIAMLRMADPLAALVVVGFVLYHSALLGLRTMDALLDAAPAGLPAQIAAITTEVDGVVDCERVRVRHAGNIFFVDMMITVDPRMAFDHIPAILQEVRARVGEILPGADIMIHTEPHPLAEESLFEKVKGIARRKNLAVHDLVVHEVEGQLTLDLHLEVEEELNLNQAHERADLLERQIFRDIPEVATINIHIEGEGAHIAADEMSIERREQMVAGLRRVATQVPDILDCHDIAIREINQKIYVSCHCLMDGELPITRVHDRTVELETLFKNTFPAIHKVTIHTEPESERGVPARPVHQPTSEPAP
jgi:cation diffusion facilitator family transporter